ncbi:hypothetical protein MPSEU_000939700 [Mayamaea pseudoterrestris]|nr:hypothetical protein MPSEU_000939700 [Mayamaea pseudoterrestris]
MSGLEAISFFILPIAAAVFSFRDQCGRADANGGVVDDDHYSSIMTNNYTYGPKEACPEVICSSSSTDESLTSGLSFYMANPIDENDIPLILVDSTTSYTD